MVAAAPLAVRMRPTSLDEMIGQDHLLTSGAPLRALVDGSLSASVILWGPPGTGKTSIAHVIGVTTSHRFVSISATSATVKDLREVLATAHIEYERTSSPTILFLDEIHRFTKAQQDVLLPAVEEGSITLIGATTQNPSFSVISALQSRCIVLTLNPLTPEAIAALIRRAIADPRGLDNQVSIDDDAADELARLASGDSRQALNRVEVCAHVAQAAGHTTITRDTITTVTGQALQRYDRDGDQHYDITSAWIKSMRGSDPNAALHWLARMIRAGEDPQFIARRLIVHASEDVGMADPTVLPLCIAAAHAVALVGLPEARINLAQATIAIATAPKSNAVISAIDAALRDVDQGRTGSVSKHLRDAHYPGAAGLGHGEGYLYPHDYPHGIVAQSYLPDNINGPGYYQPTAHGFESIIATRLASIDAHLHPSVTL